MSNPGANPAELAQLARDFRVSIVEMLTEAKSGHPGGSLSAIDVLTVLWYSEMRGVKSAKELSSDRDRFVLSKGHGVPALYAILAQKGFIETRELATLRKTGSRLQGHPDRVRLPIVEASTGSLGQGLSVAQGLALALRMDGKSSKVFCLLGDGEIQEGQVWEAALSAPKFGLTNLCAIIDANNGQIDGKVEDVMPLEPLGAKWRDFGWEVFEVDGHDLAALQKTFTQARQAKRPQLVIARTVKGKGVSFMEGKIEWHGVAPKPDELARAKAEILGGSK